MKGWDVYGIDINVGDDLKAVGCRVAQVDISSPDSIASFRKNNFGDGPIDVLLSIAGKLTSKHLFGSSRRTSTSRRGPTYIEHTTSMPVAHILYRRYVGP